MLLPEPYWTALWTDPPAPEEPEREPSDTASCRPEPGMLEPEPA
jgi:hypothetical protein